MIQYDGGNGNKSNGRGQQQRAGLPFLKTENLNFDKRTAKILAVKPGEDNRGNKQITLKISYAGNTYLWGLRLNNPNVKHLIDMFGNDEEKWVGESFLLALETDEFTNRNWPRAFPQMEAERGSKKSR